MGIKDFLEEAAGAYAAEKGLDALDPNANLLEKGLAVVAGFEGVKVVKEHFEGEQGETTDAAPADTADTASADDSWSSQAPADDDAGQDNS